VAHDPAQHVGLFRHSGLGEERYTTAARRFGDADIGVPDTSPLVRPVALNEAFTVVRFDQ
jgi:hypothetical protein